MIAGLQKTTMSKFIREGIKLRLAQYDKENNSIVTESQWLKNINKSQPFIFVSSEQYDLKVPVAYRLIYELKNGH